MGDFNGRCALTHTAIKEGDEVFFCVSTDLPIDPRLIAISGPRVCQPLTTYELRSSMYHTIHRDKNGEWINREPLWPSDVKMRALQFDLKQVTPIFGTYSGYGTINGYGHSRSDQTFMVHTSVLPMIIKFLKAPTTNHVFDILFAICQFAAFVREELFIESLSGFQYVDGDEIAAQRLLIAEKLLILKHQKREFDEERSC